MIDFKEYQTGLEQLAEDYIYNERSTPFYLEKSLLANEKKASDLFEFRKYFYDENDLNQTRGFLSLGFLKDKSEQERVVFFCLELELETIIKRKKLINLCKKYDDRQALFEAIPDLSEYIRVKGSKKSEPNNELINYRAFAQLGKSEILTVGNQFTKLIGFNPKIAEWLTKTFPDSPLFVRANPDIVSESRLPLLLTEELQTNPHSIDWKAFSFTDNLLTPSHYNLHKDDKSLQNKTEYRDYNVRGIRSLESSTSVKDTYRSFMIEELSDKNASDEILLGQCIHFDSGRFDKHNLDAQILYHLDLAINIYEGKSRISRLNERLSNGKVTDADFRTHWLRIENIPLKSVTVFMRLFFKDSALTAFIRKIIIQVEAL